jgi:hypothetical protein
MSVRRVLLRVTAVSALVVFTGPGPRAAEQGAVRLAGSSDDSAIDRPTEETSPKASTGAPALASFPSVRFRWPGLETDMQFPVTYVDLDPTTGILDWGCHQTT